MIEINQLPLEISKFMWNEEKFKIIADGALSND
jgi:hypothetical protein